MIILGNILLLLIILSIYILAWLYIGRKGRNILFKKSSFKSKIYCLIFWLVAVSFLVSSILRRYLSSNNLFIEMFAAIGAVSLAFFCYLIMFFPLTDIIKFILKRAGIKENIRSHLSKIYGNGISVFILVLIIFFIGLFIAKNPVITKYDVSINKRAGSIKSINAVMISDVHMGILLREKQVDKMIDSINKINPDIVFFCGDIVDESTPDSLKKHFAVSLRKVKAKLGIFYITGNHEYAADTNWLFSLLEKSGVKVLDNEKVLIKDSFYVAGKSDAAGGVNTPLKDILSDVDKKLPIIELNHRPTGLKEAINEKVDLELSGHTHEGQFFPNNLFTKLIFEDDYGFLKRNNFNLIVSSGYGTWGPPIRLGTKSEIVNIKINFRK